MPAIADFRYLFLRLRILSSYIKVSFRFPLESLNSSARIRDLSIVLPSRFVSDNSINPTPEISATGVMLDCRNNMNCFAGSKMMLFFYINIGIIFGTLTNRPLLLLLISSIAFSIWSNVHGIVAIEKIALSFMCLL